MRRLILIGRTAVAAALAFVASGRSESRVRIESGTHAGGIVIAKNVELSGAGAIDAGLILTRDAVLRVTARAEASSGGVKTLARSGRPRSGRGT